MPGRKATDLHALLIAHSSDIDAIVRVHADNDMDRDDLRQEIAIAVWQAMPRFLGKSSERTYVVRIAQNRAITHRLKMARRRALFQPLETEPAGIERDSAEHEIDRLHSELASAMTRLPTPQHELLALAAAGYSPRQIALQTGRTAGAVRVALHRAREAVRRWIGDARANRSDA